jgi:hypothetical protein
MRFDYQVVSDFNYLNKDIRIDLGQHLDQAIFHNLPVAETLGAAAPQT